MKKKSGHLLSFPPFWKSSVPSLHFGSQFFFIIFFFFSAIVFHQSQLGTKIYQHFIWVITHLLTPSIISLLLFFYYFSTFHPIFFKCTSKHPYRFQFLSWTHPTPLLSGGPFCPCYQIGEPLSRRPY